MIWALLLTPTAAGLLAFVLPGHGLRRLLLVLAALTHTGLMVAVGLLRPPPAVDGWVAVDDASLLFLGLTSVVASTATHIRPK